jgi:hypothetical protein
VRLAGDQQFWQKYYRTTVKDDNAQDCCGCSPSSFILARIAYLMRCRATTAERHHAVQRSLAAKALHHAGVIRGRSGISELQKAVAFSVSLLRQYREPVRDGLDRAAQVGRPHLNYSCFAKLAI